MILKFFFALGFFITSFLPTKCHGQRHYRIKADFSIKEKFPDGKMSLTMGTVYYDKTIKKIVYQIRFPEKETWVLIDTLFNRIVNGKLITSQFIAILPSFSIFDFALSNNLKNFGLDNSYYKPKDVKKITDQVITTWIPDEKLNKKFGNVVTSRKNNHLNGIAFYSPKNELIKKQLFKGYLSANGVSFPSTITEITYYKNANGTASKGTKITTYKNLVVNEPNENNIYNYPIPVGVPKK